MAALFITPCTGFTSTAPGLRRGGPRGLDDSAGTEIMTLLT